MKKCPECESENIVSDARLIERGENAETIIAFDANPSAIVFRKRTISDTYAKVCGDCGFIRLYAKLPGTLWAAYQNRGK